MGSTKYSNQPDYEQKKKSTPTNQPKINKNSLGVSYKKEKKNLNLF